MTPEGMLTAAGRLIAGAVRQKRDKLAEMWASLRRPPRQHSTEAERVEKAREEFQAIIRDRPDRRGLFENDANNWTELALDGVRVGLTYADGQAAGWYLVVRRGDVIARGLLTDSPEEVLVKIALCLEQD